MGTDGGNMSVAERRQKRSQRARIETLMACGEWFTLPQIAQGIGAASEAGVSARLRDIDQGSKWRKECERISNSNLRRYRMLPRELPTQADLPFDAPAHFGVSA